MATYAFSDVHGHAATLRRALDRIEPAADDAFFCLGDMIDRGPDPMGVIDVVRGLPNVCVLQGNHEDLMLSYFADSDSPVAIANWALNGGKVTLDGLEADPELGAEVVDWIAGLPLFAHVRAGDRLYLMSHAGIRPDPDQPAGPMDDDAAEAFLEAQDPEDLLWIREDFWGRPTGLIDEKGLGPVVVAGHTPTPYLATMCGDADRPVRDDDGVAQWVRVGATDLTGGVADRWDIDSGGAGGAGFGRITVVRLDDGVAFEEPILEGE